MSVADTPIFAHASPGLDGDEVLITRTACEGSTPVAVVPLAVWNASVEERYALRAAVAKARLDPRPTEPTR